MLHSTMGFLCLEQNGADVERSDMNGVRDPDDRQNALKGRSGW